MCEIQGDFNLMLEKSQRKGHLKGKTIFMDREKKANAGYANNFNIT